MNWLKYELHTNTHDAPIIGNILCSMGIDGFEIKDHVPLTEKEEKQMYTDIPADMGADDGSSILTFYTEVPGEENTEFFSTGSSIRDEDISDSEKEILEPEVLIRRLKKKIKKIKKFTHIKMPHISYSIEDDSQWKDKWKDNFKAFRVADDIIIKPTWEEVPEDASENDIIMQIDPGSAFGTGTHETTKLCLLSLRKYITTETTLLDAGCGSGILAICSLLCSAKSAFCLDIDPYAVEATIENAALNNIEETRIKAKHLNILEDTENVRNELKEPVDIAVANILADVIIPLSDCIANFIKPGGLFISSGILAEKADLVEEALLKNNFEIIEKNTLGEWVSFVCKCK